MKFFKQSIMALSGFVLATQANAYGLVLGPEAPVASVPEPSILFLVIFGVIAGVIVVGLSCRKSHK